MASMETAIRLVREWSAQPCDGWPESSQAFRAIFELGWPAVPTLIALVPEHPMLKLALTRITGQYLRTYDEWAAFAWGRGLRLPEGMCPVMSIESRAEELLECIRNESFSFSPNHVQKSLHYHTLVALGRDHRREVVPILIRQVPSMDRKGRWLVSLLEDITGETQLNGHAWEVWALRNGLAKWEDVFRDVN